MGKYLQSFTANLRPCASKPTDGDKSFSKSLLLFGLCARSPMNCWNVPWTFCLTRTHIQNIRQPHCWFALLFPDDLIQMDFEVFQHSAHTAHLHTRDELAWPHVSTRITENAQVNWLDSMTDLVFHGLVQAVITWGQLWPPQRVLSRGLLPVTLQRGDMLDIRARFVREIKEEHWETHRDRTK